MRAISTIAAFEAPSSFAPWCHPSMCPPRSTNPSGSWGAVTVATGSRRALDPDNTPAAPRPPPRSRGGARGGRGGAERRVGVSAARPAGRRREEKKEKGGGGGGKKLDG